VSQKSQPEARELVLRLKTNGDVKVRHWMRFYGERVETGQELKMLKQDLTGAVVLRSDLETEMLEALGKRPPLLAPLRETA
jgi:hypothetical protein